MKKLPKIYQTEINKKINNNKESCYVQKQDANIKEKPSEQNIQNLLDEIFSGMGYSYNIPVVIKTKYKIYETSLIAKTKNNIITLENEVIPISEIISIQKRKRT